jgi:hypothetical protein
MRIAEVEEKLWGHKFCIMLDVLCKLTFYLEMEIEISVEICWKHIICW